MSCCGGNCGCGSSCKCGIRCGGCNKNSDLGLDGNTSHSTTVVIFGAASTNGYFGGFEMEAGSETEGCKCNTCKCGSNCSCACCGCN